MLYIDDRKGSGEFYALAQTRYPSLPLTLCHLPYADFALMGQGPEGSVVPVGVERKTLPDLIDSTYSGRFAGHQLPGLLDPQQGYKDVWLVVEGVYRANGLGQLVMPHGKGWVPVGYGSKTFMYTELESLLLTLEVKGGLRVRQTRSQYDTLDFLWALHHWWTDKTMEQHRSHLRFRTLEADPGLLIKPSLLRQVAALLPGIGWNKSGHVSGHFKTIYDMVQADAKQWQAIPGIGKVLAERIWRQLRGLDGGTK